MSGKNEGAWQILKSGGKILRLWQTDGGPSLKQAEIALLWLSDAEYKVFREDKIGFLNRNRVFPTDVKKIVAEPEVILKSDYPGPDQWMVMGDHDGSTSNCGVMSMRIFHPKPSSQS